MSATEWSLLSSIHLALAVAPTENPKSGADVDRALIARIQNGDRRASNQLFRRHADEVFRRLTRLVGPDPEREDLVQEVFISAFRGLGRFRGESAFSTWLYRLTVHVSYAHLRRRRRAPLGFEQMLAQLPVEPSLSPEASLDQRESIRRALELLDRLKPKKRVAFILRTVEGLSLAEIAEIVGARPAAVGQRVKHAHLELAAMIERDAKRRRRGEQA